MTAPSSPDTPADGPSAGPSTGPASSGAETRERLLVAATRAFAEHGVSIQTVRQEGRGDDAQLVVVSHDATDAQLSATVTHLQQMDIVREVTSVMRVEGGAE